jgi:hypothetical protein
VFCDFVICFNTILQMDAVAVAAAVRAMRVPLSFRTSARAGEDFPVVQPGNTDAAALALAAKQHENVNSTLYHLTTNNREGIFEGCYFAESEADPVCATHKWDATGATILHQCFLKQRIESLRWIVANYPKFSLEPYHVISTATIKSPNEGRNILHMAVWDRDYAVAKWLLEFYSYHEDTSMLLDLLRALMRAPEGYVDKQGNSHPAVTPLQLAAGMSNNSDIESLILFYLSLLVPVPLSFKASARAPAGAEVTVGARATSTAVIIADVQELNSLAANEHYNVDSTYYDLNKYNRQCIGPEYFAESGCHWKAYTHKWDSNGATILHQCFQHRKYDLVKWIITNYAEFSLEPYLLTKIVNGQSVKLPYGGQNILHMAVLAKNHAMAKWILDFYSRLSDAMLHNLLTARVYTQSGYFEKKGDHYFGETPIQFAVCINDVDMVNLVMSFASLLEPINIKLGKSTRNLLFYPDCNGNNVAHLCVWHSLDKMYEHLKYFAVEMLQQELMIAMHGSLFAGGSTEEECAIEYEKFFGEDPDFKFRGHVRTVGNIRLPDDDIKKDFLLAQVYKHLDGFNKDNSEKKEKNIQDFVASLKDVDPSLRDVFHESVITAFLGLLPKSFGIVAAEVIDIKTNNSDGHLISELKRRLGRWLYGIEIGVKSGEINRMFNRFFTYGLNEDGHSPATMAASRGTPLMLRHFLKENVSQKDRSYEFDLTGIEFKLERFGRKLLQSEVPLYRPPLSPQLCLQSSISWICRGDETEIYLMVITVPEIASVVDYKWKRVGSHLFDATLTLEWRFVRSLAALAVFIEWYNYCHAGEARCHRGLPAGLFGVWVALLLHCCSLFREVIKLHEVIWFSRFVGVADAKLKQYPYMGRIFMSVAVAIQRSHLLFKDPRGFCRVLASLRPLESIIDYCQSSIIWFRDRWHYRDLTFISVNTADAFQVLSYLNFASYPGELDIACKCLVSLTMAASAFFGFLAAAIQLVTSLYLIFPFRVPSELLPTAFCGAMLVWWLAADLVESGAFMRFTVHRMLYLLLLVAIWHGCYFLDPMILASYSIKATAVLCTLDVALHLLLWNENFGHFLLTILHIVTKDFQSFGYFFGVIVVFAGLALNTVSPKNPFAQNEGHYDMGIVQLSFKLVQEAAQDESNSDNALVKLLTTFFHVTVNIVMMNLLIAAMNDTYASYNGEQNKAKGVCVK